MMNETAQERKNRLDRLAQATHIPILNEEQVKVGNKAFATLICVLASVMGLAIAYGNIMKNFS